MSETPTPERSDELLVAELRDGQVAAVEEIIRRYWPAIHRFCSNYLGEDALAEDVTQETFARLSDGTELPTGPLKPWLYRIARNRCLDILRRRRRSPTRHRRMQTGFDAARDSAGPRTRAAREERRELIRQIIEQMPEDYRSVLMLKYFENLSRSEMADVLGVTEQTVKGRLVRASQYLQEQLRKITGSGA